MMDENMAQSMSSLTRAQAELLKEFYSFPLQKIPLRKEERDAHWHNFKNGRVAAQQEMLKDSCPALLAELHKATVAGRNIQAAIFSECVYSQALANHFGLTEFVDCALKAPVFSEAVVTLLSKNALLPRYVYHDTARKRLLIQAGGFGGVDSALVAASGASIYTIEFKEPGAKTSEPDLPKYGEDGRLLSTDKFHNAYPQFSLMMNEQLSTNLSIFDHIGSNINNFSPSSIEAAVSSNYTGSKFADVICTEDVAGYLTMIPAQQVHLWATLEGEIRPGGRNAYKVWTPKRLLKDLENLKASIVDGVVTVPLENLNTASPRGGTGISRYKINSIFFVRAEDARIYNGQAVFRMSDVKQNNPTIAAKMFFYGLDAKVVQNHYLEKLK